MNKISQADIEALQASGVFDAKWYLEHYPDIKALGVEPVEHYLRIGIKLGRQPSLTFDPDEYLAANPDIAKAGMDPLLHYIRSGKAEGRQVSPNSLPIKEGSASSSSTSAKPSEIEAQLKHVTEETRSSLDEEARKQYDVVSAEFDVAYYLQLYPDIAEVFAVGDFDPVKHYIDQGASEGRNPCAGFDTSYYVDHNPDVAKSGINPFYHYLIQSEHRKSQPSAFVKEVRTLPLEEIEKAQLTRIIGATPSGLNEEARTQYDAVAAEFDIAYYLQTYPDIAEAFAAGEFDPVKHYIDQGASEGRNPSADFDTCYYLERNSDVAKSGINPFYHYLSIGRQEGRQALCVVNTKPDSVPHYGKVFYDLVEAARSRTRPKGKSSEYDVIHSEFDIAYYLACYRDIALAQKLDVIQHYINAGAREGRNPSPFFSTKHYVERYPEVKESGLNPFYHWLTIGRDKGYIALPFKEFDQLGDMLGLSAQQCQNKLVEKYSDLRERLEHGELGNMVAKAAELDPLIALSWPEALKIKIPPFHSDAVVSRVVVTQKLHAAAQFRRAKIVIVINSPRFGAGRRMEGHIAHALKDVFGADEIVVIFSDKTGEIPRFRFPDGCRLVDFADIAKHADKNTHVRMLVEFLRALRPQAVFNINSSLLWNSLRDYSPALTSVTSLYGCFFCNDKNIFGYWDGYPMRKFYRHFDSLKGICTDSHFLSISIQKQFLVPSKQHNKLTVLEAPVDPSILLSSDPPPLAGRRPQIFWASRLDSQKRLDVVYKLAQSMPEADFRLWGAAILDSFDPKKGKPRNVILEGVYDSFSDLPLGECDLWLYTSEWDGVPSILLEVSMTGIPIVGSEVGGTGEILLPEMSWPVAEFDNAEVYAVAIKQILENPADARMRAKKLREHLLLRRTPDAYRKILENMLSG